jgi:hypothetical protein
MATGFKKATVNASNVAATQTNFPSYVDLSRLGITTLAEAQSVRVYADEAKTTEWAREIVEVSEMHVLVPSLTSTVDIYVDWDGARADYGVTTTYGRDAVWADYEIVMHMQEDPGGTAPQMTDSTGIGNDGTSNGSMTSGDNVAGKLAGNALDLDGTNDYISIADPTTSLGGSWSVQAWVNLKAGASGSYTPFVTKVIPGGDNAMPFDMRTGVGTFPKNFNSVVGKGSGTNPKISFLSSSNNFAQDTWYAVAMTHINNSATSQYVNATATATDASQTTADGTDPIYVGYRGDGLGPADMIVDEVRIRTTTLGTTWLTTEYNNQNDESTFWGTWADAGGGGGGNTTDFFIMA